jgi:hypothetical protein
VGMRTVRSELKKSRTVLYGRKGTVLEEKERFHRRLGVATR